MHTHVYTHMHIPAPYPWYVDHGWFPDLNAAAISLLLNRTERENKMEMGCELRTGRPLINYSPRQKRFSLGKIYLIYYHLKVELDCEKQMKKIKISSLSSS